MSKSKKKTKPKAERATAQPTSQTRAVQHAAKHALDLTKIPGHVDESKKRHNRLPQATKKLIKAGVKSAIEVSLPKGIFAPSLSRKDRKDFQDLVLAHIGTTVPSEMATSVPEANTQDEIALESGEGSGKERENETVPTDPFDPTVFTITLGIPTAPGDHQFCIRFNNKCVVDCLSSMPSNEIWQLVHDAIQQVSYTSHPRSPLPRVIDVYQQDDGRLALSFRTAEDLLTLCTNVQWVRTFRDTISSGIQTYKVVIEFVKTLTMKMATHEDRNVIVEKIREENSDRIPSLNQIGAIRDIIMLPDPVFDASLHRSRADHAYYVVVFGSRAAANTAMDTGLLYRKKSRNAIVYAPHEQFHQQCSHCQEHSHTTKDCRSALLCGRCGYKHATRYCTSAIIECANCHGKHVASSRTCKNWLTAEDEARRSYRFTEEEEDSGPYTPTPKKPASHTLPSPELPQSKPRKLKGSPSKKLKHAPTSETQAATSMLPPHIKPQNQKMDDKKSQQLPSSMPSPAIRTKPQHTAEPPSSPPTPLNRPVSTLPSAPVPAPSALLRTIDEFRAFVAARESNANPRKRKESEYVMAGALQTDEHEGKRVKREEEEEEEGPVWPIGHEAYQPPSLRRRASRAALVHAVSDLAD